MSQVDNTKPFGVDLEREKIARNIEMQRDVRTSGERFADWLNTKGAGSIPIISIVVALLFGGLLLVLFVLNYLFIYLKHKHQFFELDFKKPRSSFEIDPKTNKMADGIFFLGNNRATGNQVFFDDSDIRTHILIFGTTGAGKTESLISLCVNFMIYGSGFIYVDGKADTGLYLSILSLLRRFGRDMDIVLISYMVGLKDLNIKTKERLSNKMNPFSNGSGDALAELIISLLPEAGGDGIWLGRASSYISSLLRVLVYLRDRGEIILDVNVIRSYLNELSKVEELIAREDIPVVYKEGLEAFVLSLAGYKKPTPQEPIVKQEFDTLQQFGFITMQFTESFGLLSDTFGHIMNTQLAECDFYDVVINRRVMVVMLPALEKSQQNLSNLGKIIISSIKMLMAATLGSSTTGKKADIIDTKPTFSDSPFLSIFDEYGYYAVKGAEVLPAQARGLGYSLIFAGQDYQAFKKSSPESAASIVANCGIKICMKLEDPTETFEIFQKAAGEAKFIESKSMKRDFEAVSSNKYVDEGNIGFETRSRINLLDLTGQKSGESHIIFGGTLVRAKMFYADPTKVNELIVNEFLEIKPMTIEELNKYKSGVDGFMKQFRSNLQDDSDYKQYLGRIIGSNGVSGEISNIREAFNLGKKFSVDYRAFFALASYIERVEFVDNKIITDLVKVDPSLEKNIVVTEKADKPMSTEAIKRKQQIDEMAKEAAIKTKPKSDGRVKELHSNERSVDSFKRAVLNKNKAIAESRSDPFQLVAGSNFDKDKVQSKLADIGKDAGIENSDLFAESLVSDIGVALIYPDEEGIKKKESDKFILDTIDEIEISDI